ncbi:MAG TPA: GAF domain-containing protein [Candidatus Dormibacteraeota bacterium]|nr:GAF domain-containing protein [Candidatus Dormibacteraeota bacterium]
MRIVFSGAAGVLILSGASMSAGVGRPGSDVIVPAIAGLMAAIAGATYFEWTIAGPMAVGSLLVCLLSVHFNFTNPNLPFQLGGLLLLALGGITGVTAYRSFSGALAHDQQSLADLQAQLEEKHRAFMVATQDSEGAAQPGDAAALTARLAQQLGATLACDYLVSADGRQYVPQPPGVGLGRLHPQPVTRGAATAGPLLSAIDAGRDYVGADKASLLELVNYVPDELAVEGLLALPMLIGERVGGFILLGNKPGGFTDDDRRLGMTLIRRAGTQLASAHAVALSQRESERYTFMNELVTEASGKTMKEVLTLVLDRMGRVVRYDSGRVALFQPDDTYEYIDGKDAPAPVEGPMARVRKGETVIRSHASADDGIFSGLAPSTTARTVNELLAPIRGKEGVLGVICLGRTASTGFNQLDASALEQLGSMAGVAVENSRILATVTGQASKLDTALDALGEISQALTTVTQGSNVLEQKTLETATRVTGASAAMLTRTSPKGTQRVIMSLGFPVEVEKMEFDNGQGIVGAVMLSQSVTALADITASFDLSSPPDLKAYGLRSALCTPMLENGELWGTLSVFDVRPREWTEDDQRVLATLGNQGVVAVRNAELYDDNQRSIWELKNLQEALQAATSTLDLNQVLQQVLAGAAKASAAQIGCLALADGGRLILKGGFGTDSKTAEKLALGLGGDICKQVMSSGQPFMEAMERKPGTDSPLNPRAVLCVPITLRGKPLGVLFLANYQAGRVFTQDHRNLVTELATQAAVAIDNATLFRDRQDAIFQSLVALANASDARDRYTAGHSQRVTQYALMIARQMKYSPKDQEAWQRLERGVRIHDIGKIGVPDAVLTKPGKLTDEEFALMKAHTTIGFNILRDLKMLTDELVIVRSHHERYDGKGYPDRKKGDELPIFAWIASAADAIDAMTSDRPYRKGMSLEVAIDQVRQGAGTHFHPDVAEAVLDAAHNGTLTIIPQESLYKDAPAIGAFENPVSEDPTRPMARAKTPTQN